MEKIVIATDGSAASAEALDFGLEVAADEDATALLVDVAPLMESSRPAASPQIHRSLTRSARRITSHSRRLERSRNAQAYPRRLTYSSAIQPEIATFAESQERT